ncbi:hypothetical protein BD779DRAFT_80472 [Infundibulicybe gibba]|nr:hypothetical protein BD779DRAFT_80472 [Infundibulicybe gibba]
MCCHLGLRTPFTFRSYKALHILSWFTISLLLFLPPCQQFNGLFNSLPALPLVGRFPHSVGFLTGFPVFLVSTSG